METFEEYLMTVNNISQRDKLEGILTWIGEKYPELVERIAWNQPMFTKDGTYIIGFSVAKNHISVAPEAKGIRKFSDDILKIGYSHSKEIFRIPNDMVVDFNLLSCIIDFNIEDKKDCDTFWRR